VELGADINKRTNEGWSPLYTAAYLGDLKTVVFLCSAGADPNGKNDAGWRPLHAAAANGHLEVCKALVNDFKAEVNVQTNNGVTSLFQAVAGGKRSIAVFLISKHADVDLGSEGGWKPIHAACCNEFPKLTQLLVEKGADLSPVCVELKKYTPLHILIATEEPPMELIKLLVDNGAKVNAKNETGGTPLHLAAFWGHFPVVKYLVKEGAKFDVQNNKGKTAMEVAASYGHGDIAEWLAEQMGEDVPEIRQGKQKVLESMPEPASPPKPEDEPDNGVSSKRSSKKLSSATSSTSSTASTSSSSKNVKAQPAKKKKTSRRQVEQDDEENDEREEVSEEEED